MKPKILIFAAPILIFATISPARYFTAVINAPCAGVQNPVTDIGERFQTPLKFEAGDKQKVIPHDGARYLRARIEVPNSGTCDWVLTVRDADFHVIQTFDREDFQTVTNRWTNRVPGVVRSDNSLISRIFLTLEGCKTGTAPQIRIPEYVMMRVNAKNPYYSAQNPTQPTYQPLYGLTESQGAVINKPLGDNVGFLMASWDRQSWTCSAVFLTKNLVLTNWHCGGPGGQFPENGYWNQQIVKDTIIDISFDDDGLSHEYIANRLVDKDTDLDFALLEVSPLDASRRIRPVTINLSRMESGALKVVHHPAADRKMITFAGCRIESPDFASWRNAVAGVDFTHKCDTEKGSSGAPIFNSSGELVGLHHRGFDVDPQTCLEKEPRVNKAVKISKIYEHLQACQPAIASTLAVTGPIKPPKQCPTGP